VKFGLREEPARTLGWLARWDKISAYTYAVSELNRANRGYRQYNFTIPLRPELRLGFPMYLPHKDMYGYIKTISINYQVGANATMSILLDTIRKRPVFPSTHQTKSIDQNDLGNINKASESFTTVYTTQPNLVMKWTNPPQPTQRQKAAATLSALTPTALPRRQSQMKSPISHFHLNWKQAVQAVIYPVRMGHSNQKNPKVNKDGTAATQLQSPDKLFSRNNLRLSNIVASS
jgi:hypothetical protein